MMHEVLIAGFGGQGVLLIGRLLTYAGMLAGHEVSWMPAYGPEMRGGTASCSVIITDTAIGSPIVMKPSVLVAMNPPSLERFIDSVQPGGSVIVNGSLINTKITRSDLSAYYVPLNELAIENGNVRQSNMIALGALIGAVKMIEPAVMQAALEKNFGHKPGVVEANMKAILAGMHFVGMK